MNGQMSSATIDASGIHFCWTRWVRNDAGIVIFVRLMPMALVCVPGFQDVPGIARFIRSFECACCLRLFMLCVYTSFVSCVSTSGPAVVHELPPQGLLNVSYSLQRQMHGSQSQSHNRVSCALLSNCHQHKAFAHFAP